MPGSQHPTANGSGGRVRHTQHVESLVEEQVPLRPQLVVAVILNGLQEELVLPRLRLPVSVGRVEADRIWIRYVLDDLLSSLDHRSLSRLLDVLILLGIVPKLDVGVRTVLL